MSGGAQDPERLSGAGGGELRALLAAGKSEVPDGAQMMALAAKLALIGAAGAGGAGGAGAAGAAGGAAAKASATAGAAIKTALALKVIGALAVVGVAGTTAVVVTHKNAPPPQAPVGLVATTTMTVSTASAQAPTPSETPTEIASVPVPPSASAAPRPKPSTTAESPEAEVKLLERAQDALRSRPDEALTLCADHAKRFPNGMLVQEREVIAIEALIKTGRKPEARARADRFESRFPGSTHTRRLEQLLAN